MHILRLPRAGSKFAKFLLSFFKAQVSSSTNFASFFNVMTHTPLYVFGSNIIYFPQEQHIKLQIFRLAAACIKIHQITHVIFGTKIPFLSSNFRSLFIVIRHNSSVPFHLKPYLLQTKRGPSKSRFSCFRLLAWKLTKVLMLFLKP